MRFDHLPCVAVLCLFPALAACAQEASLPNGVKAVWDLALADRQSTPTRGQVCLNGLWRWQPAGDDAARVPAGAWGFYKVPGDWPGIQDYMKSDYQTLFTHPSWAETSLGGLKSAWYEREITIPANWAGRRIGLRAEYLNSYAAVFIDGRQVGSMGFPCGELELTPACRPGATHRLSLYVLAVPLRAVMEAFRDTNTAKQVRGSVQRRGLCGDVFLVGEPTGARLGHVRVATSVRQGELTVRSALVGAPAGATLHAAIRDGERAVAEFDRPAGEQFTVPWKPDKLWDLHTPQNQYELDLSLVDSAGRVLDTALPVRFGYREFWIDGRDFYLNGSRIHLSAVPFDNAQVGAALATYEGAKESFLRLQSFGINFVYTHNYSCDPGTHLGFAEILRAADDTGMLFALTQPHFSSYVWDAADADTSNGYADHARWYAMVAGSHPAVVAYATSHNATGYTEDMNPDLIDGLSDPRDAGAKRNAERALRAEAILKSIDPSRLVYHHSSGNLGTMHTSNFYPNWAPIQEMDDWFAHWATAGVKPVFTVEYGAPFGWDWAMYRGWYDGKREFGSAVVPWEFCLAEWNAQFLGDSAYRITDREADNLRWEAKQYAAGRTWHRWDYPTALGDRRLHELQPVQAAYTTANLRAQRTWGVSATSPWEHGRMWDLQDTADTSRKDLVVDWQHLQRPGFSPDFIDRTYQRFDLAFRRDDWQPLATAESLVRNNTALLAWIAGPAEGFTHKDHLFVPGETFAKQVIVLNESRQTVTAEASWSLDLPTTVSGQLTAEVATGEQARLPVRINLPADLAPGTHELRVDVAFSNGERQTDSFAVQVIAPPEPVPAAGRIALFDPEGETGKLLAALGVTTDVVAANADLSGFETLVIGRRALTKDGPAPDLATVRDGLKVIVFEQRGDVLQHRLGFRVAEYGLRQVWPRVPDHAALAGLDAEALRDWRGAATLLPDRLDYDRSDPRYGPRVEWAGMLNTRVWRCGNQGNVASVLLEKPARGDFLALADGGFALQYSPLLEYREGRGMVLFCQFDVTGRSQAEPAAQRLVANLCRYVAGWQPPPRRAAFYLGEEAGRQYLQAMGVALVDEPGADRTLVAGPGANLAPVKSWLAGGGAMVAFGLSRDELNRGLPRPVQARPAEHIATVFEPAPAASLLAGVGPGEVHNRVPQELPLVTSGATILGDGVLAAADGANAVLCGLVPWRFASDRQDSLKRTYRRVNHLAARLLGNVGVAGETPLLSRFGEPPGAGTGPSVVRNGDLAADANGDGVADDWGFTASVPTGRISRVPLPAGGYAQELTVPPVAEGEKAPSLMLYQMDVPLVQDQWYRIALRAQAADWKSDQATLAVQNTDGWRAVIDYQRLLVTPSWQEFVFKVQAKATVPQGTRLQIWFNGSGTLRLADIRFQPMADPSIGRWSEGLYLDQATEWDDPYRFFRW